MSKHPVVIAYEDYVAWSSSESITDEIAVAFQSSIQVDF